MEQGFAIGKNIRIFRELRGYTQDYMANKIGVSQRTYSNIETDKSKVDTELIASIAKALNVDPVRLLSFDEKVLFHNNNHNNSTVSYFGTIQEAMSKETEALKAHIEDLKEEIAFLRH